jgi:hypothetical protein
MTPFSVDPAWYERYWLRERPAPSRQQLADSLLARARQAARGLRQTPAADTAHRQSCPVRPMPVYVHTA